MPEPAPAGPLSSPASGPRAAWLARHPRWAGLLAALSAAALFALAFPTTELAPLGFVALTPLLFAMRTRTRWQRFRMGWLAGFLVELVLFRWIPFTMSEMTSIAGPLTLGMWALYALWHGLQLGVFLMLAEPLRRAVASRSAALSPIALALFYAVVEWLWPVIFPWGLGHAIWELPGAGALLALQGVPLLTFAVALVGAALAEALATRSAPSRQAPLAALAVLAIVIVPALLLVPAPRDGVMRVAILQPNYTLAEKKNADTAMRRRLLARLEAQIRALPKDSYQLIIASEGSFPLWWRLDADAPTGPSNSLLEATRRIQRAIAEGPHAHAIIGGLRQDEARQSRNSAVHLGPDGRILAVYDKQTLVPFSEFMPFTDLFPALAEIRGIGHLKAGDAPCAFVLDGVAPGGRPIEVACGICYESLFAADTRRDAGDADLLVNLTIDTWFGSSTAPRMHLMAQASRAAELGIPLLRSALTGITALVDPFGRVAATLPRDVPGVLDVMVQLADGATAYRAVGQLFAPFGMVVSALALVDAFVRRRSLFPERAAPAVGA